MKRLFVTILASALVALSFLGAVSAAQAHPFVATLLPHVLGAEGVSPETTPSKSVPPENIVEQLKTQVLPQFETILTPEQRDRLQTEIVDAKASLPKSFKKIALSPDQKTKLASVFKTLPKKDVFASLTPEQKKGLFSKEAFKPTPEAISDKINAKMQFAKDKGAVTLPTPKEISDKISAKMKLAKDKDSTAAPAAPAAPAEKAAEALNAAESTLAE